MTARPLRRLHNPGNHTCGCSPACWCQRTWWGRALRWYLPYPRHRSVDPAWKRSWVELAGGRPQFDRRPRS